MTLFVNNKIPQSILDYQELFNSLPGLYLILTKDLKIAAATDAYLEATLVKREEVVGREIFEVFTDDPNNPQATGIRNLRASLNRVLASKKADSMPLQKYDLQRPESQGGGFEERYWSPINAPLLDSNGEVVFIMHRAEDVTSFVYLNQQNEKNNQDQITNQIQIEKMQSEVFLRATEVAEANQKLREANQMLEDLYKKSKELDQLKTNFFANVSHELRTPLTLILGPLAKRLSMTGLGEEERQDLQVAERNAQLLLKQVNNLLDIAKLEDGRLTLDYSRIDLIKLVSYIASSFESFAQDQKISFLMKIPESLITELDSNKFQRILLNLLSNAFKFTPVQGTVELKLEQIDDQVVIQVSDSGPGIPENMYEAIFERFRQVDGTSRRRIGGTGLGLAIVKEFVILHGGEVEVGKGSYGGAMFKVSLPVKAKNTVKVSNTEELTNDNLGDAFLAELTGHRQSSDLTQAKSSVSKSGLVLVVEDNLDMQNFLSNILSANYRVEVAANGKEGLIKALKHLPDLIISDIMMPEMTGDALARELFGHIETKDIPFLILSAKMDDPLKLSLLKEGVRDYINKPFSPEELSIKVEKLITERRKILVEREHLIKELTRSNEELENFAFVAAHDLKSPLRSIYNLSEWIEEDLEDKLTEKSTERMMKLRGQVRYMERLLDDVLEYSRAERKHDIAENEMIDGSTLMTNILSLINFPEGFTVEVSDNFKTLRVPQMPLQQVFYNLIQNAIKHHDKESGKISIRMEENDSKYIFSVSDDGPGIAPEYHQKIFGMFETLSSKSKKDSTGMGLALVKKHITNYDGEITIDSSLGRGSCFRFTWLKNLKQGEIENVKHSFA